MLNKTEQAGPSGTLFIIAAPSGGGKSSLIQALLETTENLIFSVSYTTRPPRPSEKEGVNYRFVDVDEFERLRKAGAFLEHAEVFGHHYATSAEWAREHLAKGVDVLLEIDWQGAAQARGLFPDCVSVFIIPPSRSILAERLKGRQEDRAEVVESRMAAAASEISHYGEFDYLVVNDVFEEALNGLKAIIHARRLRLPVQARKYAGLLENLLKNQ